MSDARTPAGTLTVTPSVFQRLMLQWEQLAPYNAAQYATLDMDVSDDKVRAAWRKASIGLGLQQLGQSPEAPVAAIAGPIEAFVSRELNRPYKAEDSPLRLFIHRSDAATSIGIFYRHAVADSASVRLLVRGWLERLLSTAKPDACRCHIKLLRGEGFKPFDSRRSWNLLRELAADISRLSRVKRVRRLPVSADPTSEVAWRRIDLPTGMPNRLRAYARRQGVRVNDLFVTAAALACNPVVPDEGIAARTDLGIGTIADVRPSDRPPEQHFGLLLGFLQTFWRQRDLESWTSALVVAAGQSKIARERSLAQASVLRLYSAVRMNVRATNSELATFYRKRCPLAAGISNVDLNRGWPTGLYPSPLVAYTRVSPLGPMLPLVFTPTTLGDSLHLGITYRTSVLSAQDVEVITASFIDLLQKNAV